MLSDQGRAGCFSWGSFVKGKRYLVYAERRTPSGVPIRNLAELFSCNRTTLVATAGSGYGGEILRQDRQGKHKQQQGNGQDFETAGAITLPEMGCSAGLWVTGIS